MFKIGEKTFNVGILELKRTPQKAYKYQVHTEDGAMHSEVRAIYPCYCVALGNMDIAEYDALITSINTYAESIPVTLPDGQDNITFDANITIEGDGLSFIEKGKRKWDGLTLSIVGVRPVGK